MSAASDSGTGMKRQSPDYRVMLWVKPRTHRMLS